MKHCGRNFYFRLWWDVKNYLSFYLYETTVLRCWARGSSGLLVTKDDKSDKPRLILSSCIDAFHQQYGKGPLVSLEVSMSEWDRIRVCGDRFVKLSTKGRSCRKKDLQMSAEGSTGILEWVGLVWDNFNQGSLIHC
jgi:hypothetical protein